MDLLLDCPKDTHPEIHKIQKAQIMQKSGAERIAMAFSMLATTRELVKANLRQRFPEISERKLQIEVFKRMYAQDFSREQLEKIVDSIQNPSHYF